MINYFYLAKFFLFLLPLNVALVTKSTLFPFIVGKYVWFRTSLDIALILFILGLIFRRKESELFVQRFLRILKMPLFLAVTAFITTFLLAGFFGFDPSQSFWSNFERGEGGLQIIHLYIFFILLLVLLETPKDWHRMLIMISIGAFLMMLYGYAALFNFDWAVGSSLEKQSIAEGNRFTGSIGNAAYVGGYLIFVAFYVFYMLVNFYQTNKKARFILYIFLAMIALTFWLASTRGSLIGLVSAVLGGLLYIGYTHRLWRKWIISTIIVFLIFGSALVKFRETSFVKSIPGSHIFDLSFNTETFRHRILMWQIAIAGWKERPIFGWGPENFYAVFDRHFDTRYFEPQKGFGAWFDRAHSVFFDYLAETGLLGLLGYFGIFATYYIEFIRYGGHALKQHSAGDQKEKKYKQTLITNAFLFGIPIAYLAQGLVLFDILTIYWNIFFVLAFAAYIFEQKNINGRY